MKEKIKTKVSEFDYEGFAIGASILLLVLAVLGAV
jgi:hypothetical protein